MYSKFSMIQDDYKSDGGPFYSLKPQDKALSSKLQALNQGKPKSFVTAKVDSKNARSGLRPCTFQLPAAPKTHGLGHKHAKTHGLSA
jgi:hypothetical protein